MVVEKADVSFASEVDTRDSSLLQSPVKKRKCSIDCVVKKHKNVAEPVFATFTNGKPAKDGSLKGNLHQNNTENLRFKKQRIFTVETPWLNYVGKNDGTDTISDQESIFIGILDKNTGKMKLVEASSFVLNPNVSFGEDNLESIHEPSYQEKQERVVSRFGSKRAKKVVNQRKMYEVNAEGMSVAIHEAATDVVVKEEDLKMPDKDDYLTLLPDYDSQAKTPEEVYRLEWIAPDEFLVNFEEIANSYIAEEIKFDEKYTNLMRVMVSIAKFETLEENKTRLICLALYVEYLVRFSKLKSYQLSKAKDMDGCPSPVRRHIFRTFTSANGKVFSAEDKDRVICLILVLALIGGKFEVFTNTLVESLQIDVKKLHLLMKAIGATYIASNFSFKLKFPLTKIASVHKRLPKNIR